MRGNPVKKTRRGHGGRTSSQENKKRFFCSEKAQKSRKGRKNRGVREKKGFGGVTQEPNPQDGGESANR